LVNTYTEIRSKKALDKIIAEVDLETLVLFSIIFEDLAEYFTTRLHERGIMTLNVLRPMLDVMSKFLGVHPDYKPGLLHVIDDRYYRKIDAIGYTVEHDDGRGQHIDDADIVLLGLSRSCKTPISMYLACNHGFKVANIPVVRDATVTKNMLTRLDGVRSERIIGLLMRPDILAHVREERSLLMTGSLRSQQELQEYYDIREITKEFRFCRDLFEVREWTTVDVTRRAIEEVSLEIIEQLKSKR